MSSISTHSTDVGNESGLTTASRPPGRSFHNVAILRPGRFIDSAGREASFDSGELSAMAAGFDPASFSPPLTLDHANGGPARGRVSALRWDGQFLRADLEEVEPQLAGEIEAGRWPGRSAEIYAKNADGLYGLRALSLLGARPPAVKGLPPIALPKAGKGSGPPGRTILAGGTQLTQQTLRSRSISMHGGCDAD